MSDVQDIIDSLRPAAVDVLVTLPYGSKVTVTMGTLTLSEWDDLGESVPHPVAPFVMHNSRGEEVRNYADPAYLKQVRQAEAERRWRRLTLGLLRGGNTIEGTLFEDQVKRVREHMDSAIAMALMRWQAALIAEGKAAIADRARRFQPDGPDETENDAALRPDAGAVEGTDGL